MRMTRRWALSAGLALAATNVLPAVADDYPSNPITLVVGYAAGGGTDVMIRAVAAPLSEKLGVPILVQNVGGAGGGVAATRVAQADADGYTLLATTSSTFSLEPLVQKTVYTDSDFTHIATIAEFQGAIFAPAEAPYASWPELVAYIKKEGRSLKHANYFQLDKVLMAYLAKREGIEIAFVPVQGGNGAVQATLSGAVDSAYSGGSWAPLVESGQAKALFATSYEHLALAPDLMSTKDLGLDIGTTNFLTISAPAATPEAVVNALTKAIAAVMDDPRLKELGSSRFMDITYKDPAATRDLLAFEIKSFTEMVAAAD